MKGCVPNGLPHSLKGLVCRVLGGPSGMEIPNVPGLIYGIRAPSEGAGGKHG